MTLRFRFHGELNDFLPPPKRDAEFEQPAGPTDTLKHVIESIGVPHTEIGRVLVNEGVTDLSTQAENLDRVAVFPFELPIRLNDARFVVDGHLGRLAAYLRMLGFDTWYERLADDLQLASIAGREQRFLLTRDVGLLKRREVIQGYWVRSQKPHVQLHEISDRFALHSQFRPFQRCMECNGVLEPVAKTDVLDLLPPHTRETKEEFSRCRQCGKVFWRGSHHAQMLVWIERLQVPPNDLCV